MDINEGIWQVDPTGQFWQCHVAVVGRAAERAKSHLLELIQEQMAASDHTTTTTTTAAATATTTSNDSIVSFLGNLSIPEALNLACRCIQSSSLRSKKEGLPLAFVRQDSNETNTTSSKNETKVLQTPMIAFSIERDNLEGGQGQVRWYNGKDLRHVSLSNQTVPNAER